MKKHADSLEKEEDDWTKLQSAAFRELLEVVMVILFLNLLVKPTMDFNPIFKHAFIRKHTP
jgi:hypothetical protein